MVPSGSVESEPSNAILSPTVTLVGVTEAFDVGEIGATVGVGVASTVGVGEDIIVGSGVEVIAGVGGGVSSTHPVNITAPIASNVIKHAVIFHFISLI